MKNTQLLRLLPALCSAMLLLSACNSGSQISLGAAPNQIEGTFAAKDSCISRNRGQQTYALCSGTLRSRDLARSRCQDDGLDLVVINSEEEQTWLAGQADKITSVSGWWIGLDKFAGKSRWVDGKNRLYDNFAADQTTTVNGCAYLDSERGYSWALTDCTATLAYLCEVSGATDDTPPPPPPVPDTTAPQTFILSGPSLTPFGAAAHFVFGCSDTSCTYQCMLDTASWQSCPQSHDLALSVAGVHHITVRAIDDVGNADPTPVSWSWRVDPPLPAPIPLADALDNNNYLWTSGGDLPWTGKPDSGRINGSFASSGSIDHNQSSSLQTSVQGAGTLLFSIRVSSEPDHDFATILIDGSEKYRFSGALDWQTYSWYFWPGSYNIRWQYQKDLNLDIGDDNISLDNIRFVPGPPPVTISIDYPVSGATIVNEANILLSSAGIVSANTVRVYIDQATSPLCTLTALPFQCYWDARGLPDATTHAITAVAEYELGPMQTSATVTLELNHPPTIWFTSPVSGTHVAGTITLGAGVSDPEGEARVTSVTYTDNTSGTILCAAAAPPWQCNWDTVTTAEGLLWIKATVFDDIAQTDTTLRQVFVDNVDEWPTLSFIDLVSGDAVFDTEPVQLAVWDDRAITEVSLFVNNDTAATVTVTSVTLPELGRQITLNWDVGALPVTNYTLYARISDSAGNSVTTTPISVTHTSMAAYATIRYYHNVGWTTGYYSAYGIVDLRTGATLFSFNGPTNPIYGLDRVGHSLFAVLDTYSVKIQSIRQKNFSVSKGNHSLGGIFPQRAIPAGNGTQFLLFARDINNTSSWYVLTCPLSGNSRCDLTTNLAMTNFMLPRGYVETQVSVHTYASASTRYAALIAGSNDLVVFDITDPLHVTQATGWQLPDVINGAYAFATSTQTDGTVLGYVGYNNFGANQALVNILDIGNANAVTEVTQVSNWFPPDPANEDFVTNISPFFDDLTSHTPFAFVSSQRTDVPSHVGYSIWSMTDPTRPKVVWSTTGIKNADQVFAVGPLLKRRVSGTDHRYLVVRNVSQLLLVDVTDPYNPVVAPANPAWGKGSYQLLSTLLDSGVIIFK